MTRQVADYASNAPENLVHAAEAVGASAVRQAVFEAIYRGKKRQKSVSNLIQSTGLSRKQVLTAGKHLADKQVVIQARENGETVYQKIDFIHRNKKKILTYARSRATREAVATKRNPRGGTGRSIPKEVRVVIRTRAVRDQVKHVTIDDIQSFAKVKGVRNSGYLGDQLSEGQVKEGFRQVLREIGQFRDWGGEQHDLYTTQLRLAGKRRIAAIAFKGPGTAGKLTPKKMGKNGDQIQRLLQSPAEVFLVQYGGQIDPAVMTQMQQFAIARSLAGGLVFYGVVDGADSLRLARAYSKQFAFVSKSK
jgi:hypothetical protein